MSGYTHIRTDRRDGVIEVTLDRPPLNAVDGELHRDLGRLAVDLKNETEARAVVLTGAGRAFSAGGDYEWFTQLADPRVREEVRRVGRQLVWDLLDVEIPMVAAVNGPAVGLGATLVLLCDAVFMADDAVLADPHVKVGIVAGDGGTALWPLVLGPVAAKRFLLTGDPVTAEEARTLGLATHVSSRDRVLEDAREFARRLASLPPLAVRYTKLAVNKWIKQAANVAFDVATAYELVTFGSDDHREALQALREKRPPRFEGR